MPGLSKATIPELLAELKKRGYCECRGIEVTMKNGDKRHVCHNPDVGRGVVPGISCEILRAKGYCNRPAEVPT